MSFTVPEFAKDAAERAAKTFAQTALAVLGAGAVDIVHTNWVGILSVAGGAAVVSILTSVASGARDDTMSPASALKAGTPAAPPVAGPSAPPVVNINGPISDAVKAAQAKDLMAAAAALSREPGVFVTPPPAPEVPPIAAPPAKAAPVGNALAPISRPAT